MKTKKLECVFVLRDAYKSPVSVCSSRNNAMRQLRILAKFEEWNRNTHIMNEYNNCIVFDNGDSVDMIELCVLNTMKPFVKTMGFEYLLNKEEE